MATATLPSLTENTVPSRNRLLEIAVSALLALGLFILVQSSPDLASSTDGYRHVTQAWRLTHEPKAMFADPWHLAYFWPRPVDPWFGYHVLLAPFAFVFERILAIKLFTSLIFGLIAYVLFQLLEQVQASHRAFWVLLAMTGSSMTLARATVARPFMLSLLLTLLAALFTIKDQPLKVALVSLVHALSYSIFFLVALAPGLWFLLRRDRRSGIIALCCAAGIALGLVANPYFPENVRYDIVQASIVNIARAAHIEIGTELSGADLWAPIAWLPAIIPWIAALILRLRQARSKSAPAAPPLSNLFLALSLITCVETIHIVRSADFFIPFAMLFAAPILSPYLLKAPRRDLLAVGLLMALPCAANTYLAGTMVWATPKMERYRGAAAYLKANAPGALVMNTDWSADYFFLFFLNPQSRYVIGIEPTFAYLHEARKYWLWRHIYLDEPSTCGQETCTASDSTGVLAAAKEIGAEYVLTDHKRNPVLERILGQAPTTATEVFRDIDLSVYQIH